MQIQAIIGRPKSPFYDDTPRRPLPKATQELPRPPSPSQRRSVPPRRVNDPQHKVNNHSPQKHNSQHRRPEPVVEPGLAPRAYTFRPPVVRHEGVHQREDGHAGEEEGGDEGGAVAKVEHAQREGAEDDGEVEPREEGALVCEEDFGLDAGGEGDTLACERFFKLALRGDGGRDAGW